MPLPDGVRLVYLLVQFFAPPRRVEAAAHALGCCPGIDYLTEVQVGDDEGCLTGEVLSQHFAAGSNGHGAPGIDQSLAVVSLQVGG